MVKLAGLIRVVLAGLALCVIAGCSAVYNDHGYAPTDSELKQVKVGDTQQQVVAAIGRPSAEGLMDSDEWYFVQSRWRQYGPFAPKVVKREVVAVSFAKSGRVTNIERFGLERGHVVPLSRRVTTSTVKNLGLLQQMFSDFGRFDPSQFFGNQQTGAPIR